MNRIYQKIRLSALLVVMLLAHCFAEAQCPGVFDFNGQVQANPYWYSCTGNSYSFNLSSPNTWGEYSIDWGDGSPLTTGTSWSPPTFINHVYTAAIDTFNVVITEINTGCVVNGVVVMEKATSASIQIPVGGLTQACAPQMMEFINSSTNVSETTVFTWDFGDGSPVLTFDHTNWLQTIQHTYEVGTVNCETVVTLTAENYCNTIQGGNSTATFNPIRIWDLDDPSITASATLLCYPDTTVTFTNTTHRNCLFQGNIYQRYEYWNFGDYWNLGHDSIINWTPWPPTFPRTMHYPGIGTYTVALLDSNFCGIAPASITIQIVPPPVAGLSATPDTVCVGQPITFLQQSTGGMNYYRWNLGNGTGWIPTGPGNITYTYNNPGTYMVGTTVGISGATAGCTDTAWVQVVVLPKPVVNIVADQLAGCGSFPVQFDAVGSNISSYQWTFDVAPGNYSGQTPPPVTYSTQGNHPVTLNVVGNNGCNATDSETIRVYPNPIVDFDVISLCEGDTASFTDMTIVSSGESILSHLWDFGDGETSTLANPTHLFENTGNFDISLTVTTTHCSGSHTITLPVEPSPIASISQDVNTGCSPVQVQFSNNSTDATTYYWQFGDGAVSNEMNPSHSFVNSSQTDTTYTVRMTASNAFGCGQTVETTVTVLPHAIASFTDNTAIPGCSPFQATFFNTSQNADSYLWSFGDGTTSNLTNPTHQYLNNTPLIATFTVTLIAYNNNGCNDTISKNILVYPIANFAFTLNSTSGCAPFPVTMPFVSGVQNFNWSFGDGATSTLPIPTHTYQNNTTSPVTYNLTLIGTSAFGCADTSSAQITVYPSPLAQFDTDVISGCSPLNVQINDLSVSNSATYTWNYSDGNTSAIAGSHNYTFINTSNTVVTRTITLTLLTTDGCTSTFNRQIQIYPEVIADFTDPGEYCSPANIAFVNTSINASTYSWNFGNGVQSVMTNPSGNFVNVSDTILTLEVNLMATSIYGCIDTASHDLVVNPTPVADFVTDLVSGCSPLTIQITNNSLYGDTYNWNFNDGSTSDTTAITFEHTYYNNTSMPVVRQLVLSVTTDEGCNATHTKSITVYPPLIAGFIPPGSHCSPANISFVNTSVNANTYEWNFGNGQQSTLANPSVSFTNVSDTTLILPITLMVTSNWGCSAIWSDSLVVYGKPIADFTTSVASGCSPLEVTLINNTLYADSLSWDYGDNNISAITDTIHSHVFVNSGSTIQNFQIVLTAITDEGCSSQTSKNVQVYPQPLAQFADPGEHCSPMNVIFENQSSGGTQYSWNFGNGIQSALTNPSNYYTNNSDSTQSYLVTLTVTSSFGCTDTTGHYAVINHEPVAAFVLSESGACTPGPVEIINQSQNADSYYWSYGDGSTSQIADTTHIHNFQNPLNGSSNYSIQLVATTDEGCSKTANGVFVIYPSVNAQFASDTIGCAPINITFTNQSIGAVSYNWSFDDGEFSPQMNPSHIFTAGNTEDEVYNVRLVATNSFGCTDTVYKNIYAMHRPVSIALMDSVYGCYPTNVNFENQSIGADSYMWVYGTGETSNTTDSIHTYSYYNQGSQLATYNISLHAYTDYGCSNTDNLSISVAPEIEADFFSLTQGCSPLVVNFDNLSTGGNTYFWNFGDGDISSDFEPQHTFFNWGSSDTTYQITLVLQDNYGCSDTTNALVNVFAQPQAGFSVTPVQQTWPNSTVTIDNNTIGGTLNFSWEMDDGTDYYVEEPGTHTYATWGEYNIELSVSNGSCGSTAIQTIEILPPVPVANFEGPASGCVPLTVNFTNLSEYATTSTWLFGDGGQANATNPVYTYWTPGTYSVTLIVQGPDGSSDQMIQEYIIQVYPSAVAAFIVTPNEVNIPSQPVYCINLSQNATTYTWDFGDGGTSTTANPVYYYQSEGIYSVELIANNQFNCPDTVKLIDVVRTIASGNISFPNAFTPSGISSNGGYYDPMSFDNDIFFPLHNGVSDYRLQIFNKWGELLFESNDVNRGWDGMYRGELCPQDVYVWKVSAQFVDGQKTEQSGDVTLIIK